MLHLSRTLLRASASGPSRAAASLAQTPARLLPRSFSTAAASRAPSQAFERVRRSVAAAPVAAPKAPASHKPPKRRLEAASLPLRNTSAPTRGPILQCIAHTTAERYDLAGLARVLRRMGVRWDEVPEGDRDRAFVIGPWKGRGGAERLISGKDVRSAVLPAEEGAELEDDRDMGFEYGERGEIWVFNSGSFVTWGLTEEEGRAFLRDVIAAKGARIQVDPLHSSQYEVEEVDFVVDSDPAA